MCKIFLKHLNECRVCGGKLSVVEKIKNVPIDGMKLSRTPCESTCVDLELFKCVVCGHYQIPGFENFRCTTDFDVASDTLPSIWKHYIGYLSSISASHNKVFEMLGGTRIIGECEKYFHKVIRELPDTLIPPPIYTHVTSDSHTVIYDYFDPAFPEGTFDAFCLFDVLVHIENIKQVLNDIFLILKAGGVGWIEVPNGFTIIDENQYFSILAEHVNYFTPHSLSTLIHLAGFQTLLIQSSLGGDHLDILFKKPNTIL